MKLAVRDRIGTTSTTTTIDDDTTTSTTQPESTATEITESPNTQD